MKRQATKFATTLVAMGMLTTIVGCGANNATNNTATTPGRTNTTGGAGAAGAVTLNETGSSLLYPLFNNQWVSAYKSVDPNVTLTAASTGSGAGISQATQGTVQIGASDAYMADAQMAASPSMMNIPLAISAQQIMYNLPGLPQSTHLKFTGDVLAQIYMGKIKYWDDSKIKALNAGVTLPHQQIIPIHRSDSSGDTFLFTQFLSDTNSAWKNSVGFNTSPSWPSVTSAVGEKGNSGVVSGLAGTKYSIGYVGISYLDQAVKQGIGYASLRNQAGNYELPQASNIQAAASSMAGKVPADERISLVYAPGASSYPIVNFEYAIVNSKQPDANTASALKKFLNWAISPTGGNSPKYLNAVHFQPLPSSILPKSQAQINKISG